MHREMAVRGLGDTALFAQAWLPEATPRAVVAISHGLGEHSGRYAELASRLVAERYAVYALDHRGHGRSSGVRANIGRFDWLVTDLSTFVGRASKQHPGAHVFLVGHSMGGAVAFASALRLQHALTGVVLSAPALAVGEAAPAFRLTLVRLLSVLAPNAGALQLPASAVSRDPAVVRAYLDDPLVCHKRIPARTIAELLRAMETLAAQAAELKRPTLVQHGTRDSLVPLAATLPIYQRFGARDRTIRTYDGLYHEVYNEPEKDRVIGDLLGWLGARC